MLREWFCVSCTKSWTRGEVSGGMSLRCTSQRDSRKLCEICCEHRQGLAPSSRFASNRLTKHTTEQVAKSWLCRPSLLEKAHNVALCQVLRITFYLAQFA